MEFDVKVCINDEEVALSDLHKYVVTSKVIDRIVNDVKDRCRPGIGVLYQLRTGRLAPEKEIPQDPAAQFIFAAHLKPSTSRMS